MTGYVNTAAEQLVVEIQVRDIGRAVAFYRGLGFETVGESDGFVALSWEGRHFFLSCHEGLPPPPDNPPANLRIMVADVDRRWEQVTGMGARIVYPIGDRAYGLRDFTFADPDGFGLRFASLLDQPAS
jgi:catechol 2,3-dioxygenase-like lactoylglutathione lyase family enzyme